LPCPFRRCGRWFPKGPKVTPVDVVGIATGRKIATAWQETCDQTKICNSLRPPPKKKMKHIHNGFPIHGAFPIVKTLKQPRLPWNWCDRKAMARATRNVEAQSLVQLSKSQSIGEYIDIFLWFIIYIYVCVWFKKDINDKHTIGDSWFIFSGSADVHLRLRLYSGVDLAVEHDICLNLTYFSRCW